MLTTAVSVPGGDVTLSAALVTPSAPIGVVVVPLRSSAGRHGQWAGELARELHGHGLASLLVDLLQPDEEWADDLDPGRWFGVSALSPRVVAATGALDGWPELAGLPFGYLASGLSIAVALAAATSVSASVRALVLHTPLGAGAQPGVRGRGPLLAVCGELATLEPSLASGAAWLRGRIEARARWSAWPQDDDVRVPA